jgi:hypothetical protein
MKALSLLIVATWFIFDEVHARLNKKRKTVDRSRDLRATNTRKTKNHQSVTKHQPSNSLAHPTLALR